MSSKGHHRSYDCRITKNVKQIVTNDIRNYLTHYQKKNGSSEVR